MKQFKVKWIGLLVLIALLATAGIAGAQEEPRGGSDRGPAQPPDPIRMLVGAVAQATGLSPQEVIAEYEAGKSPNDILSTNGADVEAFDAWIMSEQVARLNRAVATGKMTREEADVKLAEFSEMFGGVMSGDIPLQQDPGHGGVVQQAARGLLKAVEDATGLTTQEIIELARGGQTLGEIVEANGGDVDAVVAAAVIAETEQINQAVADEKMTQERADEILAELETRLAEAMTAPLPAPQQRGDRPGVDMMRMVGDLAAEATGKTARELLEQARDEDLSIAEVLEANGADVDALTASATQTIIDEVNQAVADGKMDQERADKMLENLDEQIDRFLNQKPGERPDRGGK